MKRFAQFVAIWVINLWMVYMSMVNPRFYAALRAAGAQPYSCIDWDASGHAVPSQACEGPMPTDLF